MYRSREAGVAFANGILADFELLAERVEGLHAGLDEERRLRIECSDGACTRLSEVEEAFSERADELATSLAKCVANLGAQSLQTDDMATQMQAQSDDLARRFDMMEDTNHTGRTVGDLAEQLANCVVGPPSQFAQPSHGVDTAAQLQAQADDFMRCIAQLEDTAARNDKHTLGELDRLSSSLATVRGEVSSIHASIPAGARSLDDAADLSPFLARLLVLESSIGACALIAGDNVLECRLAATESSLQAVTAELDAMLVCDDVGRKAASAETRSFQESITNLQLQVTRLSEVDEAFVERADELSSSLAKCVARLEAQSLQTDDTATQMQAQAGEFARRLAKVESTSHAGRTVDDLAELANCVVAPPSQFSEPSHGIDTVARLQAQADDFMRRTAQLEDIVALNDKHTLADLGRFRGEINSIRASMSAGARSLDDTADLSPFLSRLASVESNIGACALAVDVNVLECRLAGTESSMQAVSVELGRKASSADLKLVCDDVGRKASSAELRSSLESISNLQLQVSLNQTLSKEFETVLATLPNSVQTLMTSVKTLDRRFDTESERTNACWVSLEKAIDDRIARSDLDPLSARMGQLEQAISPLAPLIITKASLTDLQGLMARTLALEDSHGARADSNSCEKIKLAMAKQVSGYDELKSATESKIDELSSQMLSLVAKADVTANRHHDRTVDQLVSLISTENLCTKDDVNRQLELFYPKAEMDAIISRVWWRLGQSGTVVDKVQAAWNPKVVGLGCLGAGSLAGFADRPQSARQRPQSARR